MSSRLNSSSIAALLCGRELSLDVLEHVDGGTNEFPTTTPHVAAGNPVTKTNPFGGPFGGGLSSPSHVTTVGGGILHGVLDPHDMTGGGLHGPTGTPGGTIPGGGFGPGGTMPGGFGPGGFGPGTLGGHVDPHAPGGMTGYVPAGAHPGSGLPGGVPGMPGYPGGGMPGYPGGVPGSVPGGMIGSPAGYAPGGILTGVPGGYGPGGTMPGGYPGMPGGSMPGMPGAPGGILTGVPGGYGPGVPVGSMPGGYPGAPGGSMPGGYPGGPGGSMPYGPGVPGGSLPGGYGPGVPGGGIMGANPNIPGGGSLGVTNSTGGGGMMGTHDFHIRSWGDPHEQVTVDGQSTDIIDTKDAIHNLATLNNTQGGATTFSTETTQAPDQHAAFNTQVDMGNQAWHITAASDGNGGFGVMIQDASGPHQLAAGQAVRESDGSIIQNMGDHLEVHQMLRDGGQVDTNITTNGAGFLDLDTQGHGNAAISGWAYDAFASTHAVQNQVSAGSPLNINRG